VDGVSGKTGLKFEIRPSRIGMLQEDVQVVPTGEIGDKTIKRLIRESDPTFLFLACCL
jgi:hypothetical protein